MTVQLIEKTGTVRIALAQLRATLGDISGNAERLIAAAEHARDVLGASLLVCPEMALLGYPPDDLLIRSRLPQAIQTAVVQIAHRVRGITLVVGLPYFVTPKEGFDAAGNSEARLVYNAALVIRDGEIVGQYHKQLLPNYGVFDDKRHFTPGHTSLVFEHHGVKFGVLICEDVWGSEPAQQARAAGAEVLLNLNASPFDLNKADDRLRVLQQRSTETGLPIIYCNLVGGQDDMVFDGASLAVNREGKPVFQAPAFVEGIYLIILADGELTGSVEALPSAEARIYNALVTATRDYVNRNGFPGALIGMSGGIDSALVAAIAVDALGAERVWGVALPSRYTADMSNEDAFLEAQALGIQFSSLPIEPAVTAFTDTLAPTFAGRPADLTEENLQSRCRGVLLMALSNKFGYVVLTTGNKSEMAVGYATLYGDMCGGFAPIKDVYKGLVYRLARYRNSLSAVIPERVLTREPSAELRPDQRDQDSLPPYEILDAILEAYVENSRSISEIVDLGYDEAVVKRVAKLVQRAEYKRRQAPPGPKVTRRAFGRERRYPLTAVYGDL